MQTELQKIIIDTPNAPEAIGAYSQGVIVGHLLFISGQIAINPINGQIITDSIEQETKQVMDNIQAILTAAKTNFENMIKCSVYVRDISQFQIINEVYASYFEDKDKAPAREFVEVTHLPRRVNIEISTIALVN